jgi:hypothetical protein
MDVDESKPAEVAGGTPRYSDVEGNVRNHDLLLGGSEEKKLIRKLDLHIIPVVMILYLLSFLDRCVLPACWVTFIDAKDEIVSTLGMLDSMAWNETWVWKGISIKLLFLCYSSLISSSNCHRICKLHHLTHNSRLTPSSKSTQEIPPK